MTKVVYIPEVVYTPVHSRKNNNNKTSLQNRVNTKAAVIGAALLAISAPSQADTYNDIPQKTEKAAMTEQSKVNPFVPLGLILSVSGLGFALGSLLNLSEINQMAIKNLQKENENLRKDKYALLAKLNETNQEFLNYRKTHGGLGIMTAQRVEQSGQDIFDRE